MKSWAKHRRRSDGWIDTLRRHYATERPSKEQLRHELAKEHVKDLSDKQRAKREAKALDRVSIVYLPPFPL